MVPVFLYLVWRGSPENIETRRFTAIDIGITIMFSIFFLSRPRSGQLPVSLNE